MLQLEFMTILTACALFEMQYFRFESFSSSSNSTLPLFCLLPFLDDFILYKKKFFKKERQVKVSVSFCTFFLSFYFFHIPFNAYFIFLPHRVSIVMNIKAVYNSLLYTKKKRDWRSSFSSCLIQIHSSIGDDFEK